MSSDSEKDQLIDSFLSNLRLEKGLSENTIKAYSADCHSFNNWLLVKRASVIQKTDEIDIKLYLKSLHGLNLSHTTINRKLSSLKHFFIFLNKKRYVQHNPEKFITGLC